MPLLHGVNLSPFVRKVRIALAIKGIEYESVPVMPMGVSDEYKKKSPLGKIPCWEDGDFTLPDSSCIIAYLEKAHPQPALYPSDAKQFGRALWFEEYADSKLADSVGGVFFNRLVKAKVLKQPVDEDRVRQVIEVELPAHFDYFETQAPDSGDAIVGGRFSVADIALGSQFANLRLTGVVVDPARWPKLAAYVDAVHASPAFKSVLEEDTAAVASM